MSIEVKIRKDFGSFCLDVEFASQGGVLAFLGASGCGKSLTLRSIAGIVRPDTGRIVLEGKTLFDSEAGIDLPPQKRQVGLLFQNYALFPHMTAQENILAGACREKNPGLRQALVQETMEALHLQGLGKRYPAQLSGGQQQRVALARILVSSPRLLMLDEPFSALDSRLRWELEETVAEAIRRLGKPAILVSHDREEVFRFSDRIAVLYKGRIERIGEKAEVFARPETKESALMTGCENISRAHPLGERRLAALDWGMTLECAERIPAGTAYVGIRAHALRPARPEDANRYRLRTVGCIENPFSRILLLKKADGEREEAKLQALFWQTTRKACQEAGTGAAPAGQELTELCLPPEKLLLLK